MTIIMTTVSSNCIIAWYVNLIKDNWRARSLVSLTVRKQFYGYQRKVLVDQYGQVNMQSLDHAYQKCVEENEFQYD